MKCINVIFLLSFFYNTVFAQHISILDSGHKTSLRGLSIVDNNIIWASGSNGTIARSTNGGKTFEWLTVKGFEQRDFRDIEAFDSSTALIMAVDAPSFILKTKDGGRHWKAVFADSTKGMFLDAMDFANDTSGIIIGDPINNKVFLALTEDQGERWFVPQGDASAIIPQAFPNEAFFAASGTNISLTKKQNVLTGAFVSGGSVSRIFYNNEIQILPMNFGKETTGANSIDIDEANKKGVVVGGDFAKDKDSSGNCILINFAGGIHFFHPKNPPHGYRSCVIYLSQLSLLTCGTSGVDISNDAGFNWQLVSTQSFNVCQKAKHGSAVFLAGANGKIAKWTD
jgi:hypothetical protein